MERKGQALNLYSVMDQVRDGMETLWNAWGERDRADFESALRLVLQEVEAFRLESPELNVSIPYQLGRLDGYAALFEQMFRAEERGSAIRDEPALQTDKARRILLALYRTDGMKHGELAAAVESSYSSLTNIMKKVLASGAVESVRSGRNTRYHLTEAGRKYCERYLGGKDTFLAQIREAAREGAAEAIRTPAGGGVPSQQLGVGDTFIPMGNHGFGNPVTLQSITSIGKLKFAELGGMENTEDEESVLSGTSLLTGYRMRMEGIKNDR